VVDVATLVFIFTFQGSQPPGKRGKDIEFESSLGIVRQSGKNWGKVRENMSLPELWWFSLIRNYDLTSLGTGRVSVRVS